MSLGVYFGNNFLATRPDNPTGYWEDKTIVDLNERLLGVLGTNWEDPKLIRDQNWDAPEVSQLRAEASDYLASNVAAHNLWGFKDPRTIRVLPFWRMVMQDLDADYSHLLVIRNPLSVAGSLMKRQATKPEMAHLLWLAYAVPSLEEFAGHRLVVVDYDVMMDDPRDQLTRIANSLEIPIESAAVSSELDQFTDRFLDQDLRHNLFDEQEFDVIPGISPLSREAYLWLLRLATDRLAPDSSEFISAWERIRAAVEKLFAS